MARSASQGRKPNKRKASSKSSEDTKAKSEDVVQKDENSPPEPKIMKKTSAEKNVDDYINVNNNTIPSSTFTSINSLAKQIILTFYSTNYQDKRSRPPVRNAKWLDDCEKNGTIERCFWPWFLHRASNNAGTDSIGGSTVEMPSPEVAFALAILSNRRGAFGSSTGNEGGGGGAGGGADSQLWFVVDDYDYGSKGNSISTTTSSSKQDQQDGENSVLLPIPKHASSEIRTEAFSLLLISLLRYNKTFANGGKLKIEIKGGNQDTSENETLFIVTQMEVAKFFIASFQSMELRYKKHGDGNDVSGEVMKVVENTSAGVLEGPLVDLVGVRLWDAVPRRKKYLEMKRDGLLRKRYQLYKKRSSCASGGGAEEKDVNHLKLSFLPGIVKMLLDALAYLGDRSSEGNEIADAPFNYADEDDEDAPSDDDNENRSDSEVDVMKRTGSDGAKDNQNGQTMSDSYRALLLRGFISKCLELLLDLLSYPQTRVHVAPYLSSQHLAVKLAISKLYLDRSFVLFRQQVDMFLDSERMEVATAASNGSGLENVGRVEGDTATQIGNLPHNDVAARIVNQRAHILQKLLHRHHAKEASEVVFAGVGRVTDAKWLKEKIAMWTDDTLYDVCYRLRLVDDDDDEVIQSDEENKTSMYMKTADVAKKLGCTRRELLESIFIYHHSSRQSDGAILSSAPLYPTEALLWDRHSVPPGNYGLVSYGNIMGITSLSLPKLNARFLSAGDYLLRNFRLFRLESAYEIRADLVDAIKRMRPVPKQDGYTEDSLNDYYGNSVNQDENIGIDESPKTEFQGWARMGLELGTNKLDKQGLRLIRVDPPRLGESVPANVIAELVLDLRHCAASLAAEWDEIGEFDNLFLVSVDASKMTGAPPPLMGRKGRRVPDEEDFTFPERYGIQAVRGCMVLELRDEAGIILSDPALAYEEGGRPDPKGKRRFLRVALDPAQYAADALGRGSKLGTDVYDTFNLVVRRHGRENNFKAVLETIRSLMRGGAMSMYRSIPSWLMPVILGYGGDPAAASFSSPKLKAFAARTAGVATPDDALDYGDTFIDINHLRESFPGSIVTVDGQDVTSDERDAPPNRKKYRVKVIEQGESKTEVVATTYPFPPRYNGNPIRFTPVQVKAIRYGLSPGLTTIIGPPGTGKTDVAVQIISNLYHSFPTQKTVIVTHSNAALNDIFDKVMARGDVDERYMLRLGSGEKNLQTTSTSSHDFTKNGRVAHILFRRGILLEKVQKLSEALGVSGKAERGIDGSPSYTCETSEYFYLHHVKKRMDLFETLVASGNSAIFDIFPFTSYFPELETEGTLSAEGAREKFSHIKAIFDELAEYRPIELLRSQRQRTDYLLTTQARIVAMTCTHAAIARAHLVELGFHYDNIIMEEAGQMLDVETFVPLLLQRGESDDSASAHSRLKRVCLIGDHNQLPPVVKNVSFSKFSRYDQSLFTRLIRLGVPSIELNKQGRARPELARLYR